MLSLLNDLCDDIRYIRNLDELDVQFQKGLRRLDVDRLLGQEAEETIADLAETIRFVAMIAERKRALAGEES